MTYLTSNTERCALTGQLPQNSNEKLAHGMPLQHIFELFMRD